VKKAFKFRVGQGFFRSALIGVALLAAPALLAEEDNGVQQLRQMSLEELMNIEVTSVSKKEQRLNATSAAIAVLTSEDLRRSGVTHFEDALRLIPGLVVAQMGSQNWAISVRGFNDMFANKLLVMIDGRSIYTPLFSGVFWDMQNPVLEDIDRIEVIRGPGASVWGANAVNGVINIISKSAKDTQGGMVSVAGGNMDPFIGSFRYGMELSDSAWLRISAKYNLQNETTLTNGQGAGDDAQSGQVGFRTDWESSDTVDWTLQGDVFLGEFNQIQYSPTNQPPYVANVPNRTKPVGANILGRWTKQLDADSQVSFQSYFDYTRRSNYYFEENLYTWDADLNYRVIVADRHDISVGVDGRVSTDDITAAQQLLSFSKDSETHYLASVYAQDDWSILPDELILTFGSKLQYNNYTGFEPQPTIRLAWTPNEHHTLWGAVSRATRTPSRAERSARILDSVMPPGVVHPILPGYVTYLGNGDFGSEELTAYELGYRIQPNARLSFDLALFFQDYDNLRGFETGPPYPDPDPPGIVVPIYATNDAGGYTYGAELAARWQATDWWQWRLSYTFLEMELEGSSSADVSGKSPQNQFSVQSLVNLPFDVEFDSTVRYVGELPGINVPSYLTLDLRLGWRPVDNLEFSISGRNLIDSPHQEFAPSLLPFQAGLVQRSVVAGIRWDF